MGIRVTWMVEHREHRNADGFWLLIADDNRDLNDHPEDDLKRQRSNYNGDQLYSNVRVFSFLFLSFFPCVLSASIESSELSQSIGREKKKKKIRKSSLTPKSILGVSCEQVARSRRHSNFACSIRRFCCSCGRVNGASRTNTSS